MSDAFGLWSRTYDEAPNALLQLGDRALSVRLGPLKGLKALDAGCGTGRWMRRAIEAGAAVTGIDGERAMLERAPRGAVVLAALGQPPFPQETFDLAVAAFSLSYAESPAAALAELCDVVRSDGRVAVVDLHPDAVEAGWRRTFRGAGQTVEIPSRVKELEDALQGPPPGWRVELLDSYRFGEQERGLFEEGHWTHVRDVWAVRLALWRRQSD